MSKYNEKYKYHYDLNEIGELHNDDGPAVKYDDGSLFWYNNGKPHRLDGPAVIVGKYQAWYKDGLLHRDDGAAVEYPDGSKQWYKNGQLMESMVPVNGNLLAEKYGSRLNKFACSIFTRK